MRLLSWNVLAGGGLRCGPIVETLRRYDADVIALQGTPSPRARPISATCWAGTDTRDASALREARGTEGSAFCVAHSGAARYRAGAASGRHLSARLARAGPGGGRSAARRCIWAGSRSRTSGVLERGCRLARRPRRSAVRDAGRLQRRCLPRRCEGLPIQGRSGVSRSWRKSDSSTSGDGSTGALWSTPGSVVREAVVQGGASGRPRLCIADARRASDRLPVRSRGA